MTSKTKSRQEVKIPKKITKALQDFLREKKRAGIGWADITQDDLTKFAVLLTLLSEAKTGRDCDGDLTLRTFVYSRNHHQPVHYKPVPYCSHLVHIFDPQERMGQAARALETCAANLRIAERDFKEAFEGVVEAAERLYQTK